MSAKDFDTRWNGTMFREVARTSIDIRGPCLELHAIYEALASLAKIR